MRELTEKQKRFVDEYMIDLNATQAAIRAGYSEKSAASIGEENLRKPEIQAALTERMKKRAQRTEVTQDYVLATIVETIERCKQAVPVKDSQGNLTGEWKFEPAAIFRGTDQLGKHLAMWTEKRILEVGLSDRMRALLNGEKK